MNVVIRSTDGEGPHSILSRNAANVRPESRFQLLIDEWKSLFRAEDIVNHVAYVGMWHEWPLFSAVRFADYLFSTVEIPAINRWAIFDCPFHGQ